MHAKGSVTVKSVQGSMSVTNEDGVVLTSLSTGESITLPSVVASSKSPTRMAAADDAEPQWTEGSIEGEGFLGLPTKAWLGIGGAVVVGVVIWLLARGGGGGDHDEDSAAGGCEDPACIPIPCP